jgi:hypothetical protein
VVEKREVELITIFLNESEAAAKPYAETNDRASKSKNAARPHELQDVGFFKLSRRTIDSDVTRPEFIARGITGARWIS